MEEPAGKRILTGNQQITYTMICSCTRRYNDTDELEAVRKLDMHIAEMLENEDEMAHYMKGHVRSGHGR